MDSMLSRLMALAAQCQPATGDTTTPNPLKQLLPMFVIIGVMFYFLILRPQKQEQRKREEMLNQLGKGDEVITAGGICGTVESVDTAKGIVTVAVAPKVTMKFTRASVSTIAKKKGKGGDSAAEGEGK